MGGIVDWHRFVLLIAAHFLALLSPGPDFFLLMRYALLQGARVAALASLGIALANGVFIVAAIAGVTLLRDQPLAYALLYWSGCAYLAWLGWRFWHEPAPILSQDAAVSNQGTFSVSIRAPLITGFLSGILNPKNALFYLALFILIVGRDTPVVWQSACGLWMFFAVLCWDCALSAALGHPRVVARFSARLALIQRASALILWLISAGMLWSRV